MLLLTRPRSIRRTRPARLRRPAPTRPVTRDAMHAVDPLSARRHQATDRWVGRALLLVFAASAISAVLGVVGAIAIAPTRVPMESGAAALTVALFGAIAAFALALHWRATQRLTATLAAAQSEIVERIAAEARLRETSEILSAILTSSPVATQAFDREGRVIVWNPASERTFGWSAEELVGRPLPEAMLPSDERAAAHPGAIGPIAESTAMGRRVRRLTKDGDERWVDLYAAPLLDRDGTAIGVAGQMVDVTERVRIDAQLAQAQKMGAVGLLASGIAHDFNNTLAAAAGYAGLIRSGSDGDVREDATTLLGVVDRGRELTRQLLAFARGSDGPPAVVDLRDVVLGIEPLIRRLIGETVAVEVTLPSEALPARIQVGQLEQSLINLAINGRVATRRREPVRRAVDVDRGDDLAPGVGDPGRHRADVLGVFAGGPGIAVELDPAETLAELPRVGHRPGRESLERPVEIGVDLGRRTQREHRQAGRHGVEREPGAGPVADADGVVAVDLVDVVDQVAVGHRQTGDLADRARELDEVGPGDRHEAARPGDARREALDPGPEPVARVTGNLLNGPLASERHEHPGGSRLRQPDALGDLGDTDGAVGQRSEHREGAFDGLDSGHPLLRRLDSASAFHHTAPFHDVEPAT